MVYEIKIEAFQGPFDLLFYLINKNQVDIYDIPIAEITGQYLAYLRQMETMDLEVTSEFLVLAARLLAIKAKMLLPKPVQEDQLEQEEEADPREELVSQLLEYQMFKEVAGYLREQEQYSGKFYTREVDPEELIEELGLTKRQLTKVSLSGLAKVFHQLLAKLEQEEELATVEAEELSVEKRMEEIIKKIFLHPQGLRFSQLCAGMNRVRELIVTVLALLELSKLQQIFLEQLDPFGDILIFRNGQKNA